MKKLVKISAKVGEAMAKERCSGCWPARESIGHCSKRCRHCSRAGEGTKSAFARNVDFDKTRIAISVLPQRAVDQAQSTNVEKRTNFTEMLPTLLLHSLKAGLHRKLIRKSVCKGGSTRLFKTLAKQL